MVYFGLGLVAGMFLVIAIASIVSINEDDY